MNELDGKLTLLHEGSLDVNDFMDYLLGAQVFMPIQDASAEVGGEQSNDEALPLLIEVKDENGDKQLVMPIFSDPEQSTEFLSHFEEYTGGILVKVSWIVGRAQKNMGISLNPNMDLGLDLDPITIEQLVNLKQQKEKT